MSTSPPARLPSDIGKMLAERPTNHRHSSTLGIRFVAHGENWAELALDYRADLVGDVTTGILASGPIIALMDNATGFAVHVTRGKFLPMATLDLRIDYLRAAVPGRTIISRGTCYKLGRSVSFVRGIAHDGDPDDPIAHATGTFMLTNAE